MHDICQKGKREKRHRAWTMFDDVWQIYKQIWYAPFIWAFAWFSYWIIYDSVVLNKPFAELNLLNCIGATTSAIFILAAFWRRGGRSQVEMPKLQKPQVLQSSNTGRTKRVIKSSQTKPLIQQPSSRESQTLPSFDCSRQNGAFGGIDQCLICANLIDCTYRRNKLSELEVRNKSRAPRLFAEEMPVEKVVAS